MWRMRRMGYKGGTWVAYFWFIGWDCISFGIHICLSAPNLEVHLPFGFIRLGRRSDPVQAIIECGPE